MITLTSGLDMTAGNRRFRNVPQQRPSCHFERLSPGPWQPSEGTPGLVSDPPGHFRSPFGPSGVVGRSHPRSGESGCGFVVLMLVVLLILVNIVSCWKQDALPPVPQPPPPPVARPKILKEEFVRNLLVPNELHLEIQNEGPPGWVRLEAYTWIDRGGEWKRGESDAERVLRKSLTRDPEPPPKYVPNHVRVTYASQELHFEEGETQTVKLILEGHNWASPGHLSSSAVGLQPSELQPNSR
ncbi:MAG TPA: hypothetical protein VNQ76_14525 [Planctomicrobium sp.]|nr:hypothetical protein [Planctomicrobium sp.]